LKGLRIAVVAGEASGDQLGVALMEALRARRPDIEFRGVAGPKMRTAGCQLLAAAEELAVMGLFEVLGHLPRLWLLRRRLVRELAAWQPDVFVGIDAPAFNLGLAAQLKQRGLRTVQYVSPQVWAWRPGRVRHMADSVDRVLCLLPFEPPFYAEHALPAEFVGHPLADQIPLQPQRDAARAALGLAADARVLAVLPGSRRGEVQRLGPDFISAARSLAARHPGLQMLAPMASPGVRVEFERQDAAVAGLRLLDGQARTLLQAADVALVASGTATLEALLCGCPLVAAYRFGTLTSVLLQQLRSADLKHFSLPNLLAGETLVPEFFQNQATGEALAGSISALLDDAPRRGQLQQRFLEIHRQLRCDGAVRAADAILRLMNSPVRRP